jgi:hypothetical protein
MTHQYNLKKSDSYIMPSKRYVLITHTLVSAISYENMFTEIQYISVHLVLVFLLLA